MRISDWSSDVCSSDLSIMEWAPLSGALPPLSQAEWERLFDLYRQIPEYRQVNAGMDLAAFKTIFWWDYIHRLWDRLIRTVFVLPLAWFWLRGRPQESRVGTGWICECQFGWQLLHI